MGVRGDCGSDGSWAKVAGDWADTDEYWSCVCDGDVAGGGGEGKGWDDYSTVCVDVES